MDEVGRQMDPDRLADGVPDHADGRYRHARRRCRGRRDRPAQDPHAGTRAPPLQLPSPVCIHTPILNGLDGKKMSSSQGNYISVADSEDEIRKKCRRHSARSRRDRREPGPPGSASTTSSPRLPEITIKRHGEVRRRPGLVASYAELESAYANKGVHPLDLMNGLRRRAGYDPAPGCRLYTVKSREYPRLPEPCGKSPVKIGERRGKPSISGSPRWGSGSKMQDACQGERERL